MSAMEDNMDENISGNELEDDSSVDELEEAEEIGVSCHMYLNIQFLGANVRHMHQ